MQIRIRFDFIYKYVNKGLKLYIELILTENRYPNHFYF